MEPPGGRDSRFNLGYSMNLLSGETPPEIYGNPAASLGGARPPSGGLQQLSPRHHAMVAAGACGGAQSLKGGRADVCYDERGMPSQGAAGLAGLDGCAGGGVDVSDDAYGSLQVKKSPPSNGKKTKGRVKIKMEYIENKLRRYTTFSKRKTGIMKKAYELSTLTGTQVMLLVASETGHVYTFATRKLQPMITSEAGKALIQTCLNSPDPPVGSSAGDQRMSATGFEETELTYNISDEDCKEENMSQEESSADSCSEEEILADGASDTHHHTLPGYTNKSQDNQQQHSTKSISSHAVSSTSSSAANNSSTKAVSNHHHSQTSVAANHHHSQTSAATNHHQQNSSSQQQQPSMVPSPVLYQTSQGMMYATPSNGGVIFSLAAPQGDAGSGQPQQYITIPLSMVAAAAATNGQGELDLSKRK